MEESDSGTFSKSLNVSKLASMFQQADITLPVRSTHWIKALKLDHQARSGKSALIERTDSRVSRFSNARAKFQAAQAFQKEAR